MLTAAKILKMPDRISSKHDLRRFQAADLHAHGIDKWSLLTGIARPEIAHQRKVRNLEHAINCARTGRSIRIALWKFLVARSSLITGIQLPPNVAGPGLAIAHHGTVVINSDARIGKLCRIHTSTNIGSSRNGAPSLGSFVYVGPGSVIYGPINVGDHVAIGANSVVNKDVRAGVTVAGSPAREIAETGSETILPTWLSDQEAIR